MDAHLHTLFSHAHTLNGHAKEATKEGLAAAVKQLEVNGVKGVYMSVAVIAGLFLVMQLLRVVLKLIVPSKTLLLLIDEFLLNVIGSACVVELGVTAGIHGVKSQLFGTCLFMFVCCKFFYVGKVGLYATPCTFLDQYYYAGRRMTFSLLFVPALLAVQFGGSLLGQFLMKDHIWCHLGEVHVAAEKALCNTQLNGALEMAFAVEFIGSVIGYIIDFTAPGSIHIPCRAAAVVLCARTMGHISGAWMNPMLAITHTFRCAGHPGDDKFFLVYWGAPFLAGIVCFELKNLISGGSSAAAKDAKSKRRTKKDN